MDRDRHQRLMGLFEELCDLPETERERRLAEVRAGDTALGETLARMLAADRAKEGLGGAPTVMLRGARAAAVLEARTPELAIERPAPERIGHYRLLKKLGAGGMGEVHAAIDERLGRKVAIKLLPEGTEFKTEARMRMLREAQAASALHHPGIVTLFDAEAHEGRLYLVMEFVDGESFHVLAEQGIPQAEALRLAAEAADALGAAHAAGVLHRDIKGENLMRARTGGVKLLDFGVAKILDEALHARRSSKVWELASPPRSDGAGHDAVGAAPGPLETRAGVIVGTPSYMAPEQTEGAPPTERTEVFSLGVVLYELLTGVRPFSRGNLLDTVMAVRECKPLPPSQRAPNPRIPGDRPIGEALDALVLRALARAPEERFASMTAFAAAIRALVAAPPRRRNWPLLAAAVAAAAAAAVGFVVTRGGRSAPAPMVSGAARRLTFDPGCEEFPSFTPDGKTLVFDALVDGDSELVALDLESGGRRRLTRTPGWDYAPAVSPDGLQVAYFHQRESNDVRVLPLAGALEATPISVGQADGYAAWSARNTLLIGAGGHIREWDRSGGLRDVATVPADRRALFIAPYRDGKAAVLLGTSDQELPPMLALLDGDRLAPLPIRDAAEYPIAASPSGTGLYYQRTAVAGVELVRRARSGEGASAVLEGGISATGSLAFSPDGTKLAYSTCRATSFLARIAGGRTEPLTRAGGWTDGFPVAAGGERLLFTSDRAGCSQIWRQDGAGGAAEPVTGPGTLRAAVSRDGKQLAWAALSPPGIVVAELDERGRPGKERRLTDRPGDTGPQFTRDGRALVFVRLDETGGERVWVVPVAGGTAATVTPAHAGIASASPVADEVVYLRSRGEAGVAVLAVDLAGKELAPVLTLPPGVYRSLRHAPDGTRLVLIREDQEVMEIDRRVVPPTVVSLWRGGVDSVTAVDYAGDGASVLASVVTWDGDVWMVEGKFHEGADLR